MKRHSYNPHRKERREAFQKRVKEPRTNWPRISKTKTYEFFILPEQVLKLK